MLGRISASQWIVFDNGVGTTESVVMNGDDMENLVLRNGEVSIQYHMQKVIDC